jgi:dTDP-4-dehydrorhamnose 3,5-epimerase
MLLQPDRFVDQRGVFVKTYNHVAWEKFGVHFEMREEFYSSSRQNVIRGMHFQVPPYAHDKVVYCLTGSVLDVLLDLRPGANYGRAVSVTLSSENGQILFIPAGVAHGFKALRDDSLLVYKTSTVHVPDCDQAIRWNSFGFDWGTDQPILSERDRGHPGLDAFDKDLFGHL